MTPKEQAQEIFNRHFPLMRSKSGMNVQVDWEVVHNNAKKCALITVEFVMKELLEKDWGDNQWRANEYASYWNNVKENLINMKYIEV